MQPHYLPEMELLGGVLAQTSWMQDHGPEGLGTEYFRSLQTFFKNYKNHEAIHLAEEFIKAGFTYDAPPAFICHLNSLPKLELAHEYSDYLLDRADGRQNLENFRIALQKLAQQSNFLGFYQTWEPYLKKSLQIVAEDFRSEVITRWLEDFFGWTADEFCVIMSPSMFNAYYGATVESSTGGLIAYQIIGESGVSLEKPQFPSGLGLEHLTVHEFGHFFVNPSMESLPARAKALERLLLPVLEIMQSQAYPSITIFLNEQVLRAIEIIAARDLFDEGVDEQLLIHHKEAGFYLMDYVLEQLNFYQENRGNYPTFGDFVPFLYDSLEQYSASL